MNKFLVLLFLYVTSFGFAQEANVFEGSDGSFRKASKSDVVSSKSDQYENQNAVATRGPGNEKGEEGDDELPIDDYIPVLLVAAGGMIVYFSHKKSKLNMKI